MLEIGDGCVTGNPIDDCWRCDPNWGMDRQRLADCGIGFGQYALGGKGGQYYIVTDSSDQDAVNPTPGTLRHAVLQTEPLWIVFASSMLIKLKHELIVNSYKTIDGRGVNVDITGGGCITLQYVTNVIIHNIRIYNCKPSGNTLIRSSPTHVGQRGLSDGDGISISGSRNIWIDHCSLSHCTDGLIDAILGSTAITISNNYFTYHNEVMLMGHDDAYLPDKGMQGVGLVVPNLIIYIIVIFNDEHDIATYTIKTVDDPRTINKSVYIKPPGNIYSFNELVSLWEKKIGTTLEKIYLTEDQVLKNIEESPFPLNLIVALSHSIFVKGDQTNFEIEPSFGVEASELYPDVKYTTVDEYLSRFV